MIKMLFFLFFLMNVLSRCQEVNVRYLHMLQKGAFGGLQKTISFSSSLIDCKTPESRGIFATIANTSEQALNVHSFYLLDHTRQLCLLTILPKMPNFKQTSNKIFQFFCPNQEVRQVGQRVFDICQVFFWTSSLFSQFKGFLCRSSSQELCSA